ncbi:2-aminoadipate transaminase [compost metagenome]
MEVWGSRLECTGDIISFAGKNGDGGNQLDRAELEKLLDGIERLESEAQEDGGAAAGGYLPLRKWLSEAYEAIGEHGIGPERMLLTGSAEEALGLLLRAVVKLGDAVLVETPASPEALALLRERGAVIVPVACDRDGMLPDHLREVIRIAKPALVYVTPQYSNPSGTVWSRMRRLALLDICDRYGIPIVEDDSAGIVPFVEPMEPDYPESSYKTSSLYRLRQEEQLTGAKVIGIASFESTLCPSRPVSWIISDPLMVLELSIMESQNEKAVLKKQQDQDVKNQHALYALLSGRVNRDTGDGEEICSFSWRRFVLSVKASYMARRTLMLELLQGSEWEECDVQYPGGGLYLWVSLPSGLSSEALKRAAMLKGVTFMPGSFCYATSTGIDSFGDGIINESIRLNYAAQTEDRLRRGMTLIGEALSEFTARSGY